MATIYKVEVVSYWINYSEEELEKRMNNPDIYYIVNDYRIYKHCYDLDDYKYTVYHNKQRTFRTKKEVYDIYKQEGIEDIPILYSPLPIVVTLLVVHLLTAIPLSLWL